jgi:hypothetical protein
MPANVRQLIARQCKRNSLAGIGQHWQEVERVMGIEYIAGVRLLSANQTVADEVARCV